MTKMTVGELLLRCLRAEGIEMMSGIIDGAHIPIVAKTPDYGIRYINAHHEEAAVHIAEGYARIARKPGVVLANPGCGTANMLAGLVSAHAEGHPIVALATLRNRLKADPNRGAAWQAADTESMARPITKYSATVRQWERLPEMMRAAFRAAMTGRPGPSYLAVPDDVLAIEIDADTAPPSSPLPVIEPPTWAPAIRMPSSAPPRCWPPPSAPTSMPARGCCGRTRRRS